MVVTLALPGETETEDKLRISASGTSEALALEREPMTGRACMGLLLSTTSRLWQYWIVSSFWPERTKSSVGASLGKSGNVLELIPPTLDSLWNLQHVNFTVGNCKNHFSCTYMVNWKFPRPAESHS